jgi:prepilin-type N-terminal cleavage/methylation domain-containing protein
MITHLKKTIGHKTSNAGFTLAELLFVVAVIGIFAAIAIPSYLGYLQKSKETVCLSNRAAADAALLRRHIHGHLGGTLPKIGVGWRASAV